MIRPRKTLRKWRPEDGVPEFTGFTEAIEKVLPPGAPGNARAVLDAHWQRLCEQRLDQTKRVPAAALKRLARSLQATIEAARKADWSKGAAVLEIWAQGVERELAVAQSYGGQRDPVRGEFLFAILREYQEWGGDLGSGTRHVPARTKQFLCALCAEAGVSLRPSSIWRVRDRFRRVQFAEAKLQLTDAGVAFVAAWRRH
jgi:hypothetical protein